MTFCRSIIGFSKGLLNLNGYRTTAARGLLQRYSTENANSPGSSVTGDSGKAEQTISEYEAKTSNELGDDLESEMNETEKVVESLLTKENHPFKVARARNLQNRGWQPTLETHSMLTVDGVPFNKIDSVYVSSSKNNTIMNLVDATGTTLYSISAGAVGFKNCKKSTAIAGQAVGLAMSDHIKRRGIKNIRVLAKGFGNGRLPAIKALQMSSLNIVSLTDRTPIPLTFAKPPRPPVPRRI